MPIFPSNTGPREIFLPVTRFFLGQAQRFSTNPTPVLYHHAIKDGEAIKRKEYVDIHDVGGLNPKDYAVLLTDVDGCTKFPRPDK